MVYLGARYTFAARFLSPDPAPLDPTNPVGLNRYAYANDNPVRFTDPDGRQGVPADQPTSPKPHGCGVFRDCAQRDSKWVTQEMAPEYVTGVSMSATRAGRSDSGPSLGSVANSTANFAGSVAGYNETSWLLGGKGKGALDTLSLAGRGAKFWNRIGVAGLTVQLVYNVNAGSHGFRDGNYFSLSNRAVGLGWSAYGTFGGPAGVFGNLLFMGASDAFAIPAVHRYTITPLVDAVCAWPGRGC